jgi:hypothetical protein
VVHNRANRDAALAGCGMGSVSLRTRLPEPRHNLLSSAPASCIIRWGWGEKTTSPG